MNYKVVENILSNIYQFAFDNKIIVAVLCTFAFPKSDKKTKI